MTNLQLCQATRREYGIPYVGAATPIAVAAQTGILGNIVDAVKEGWTTIQNLHPDWHFLRGNKAHTLTIGTRTYNIASAVVPGMGLTTTWRQWDKNGLFLEETSADKSPLVFEEWTKFRSRVIQTGTARPKICSVNLSGDVEFDVTPDKAYIFRGDYWKTATVLANDGDTPVIATELHEVIVFEAVMRLCGKNTAGELYQHASSMRDRLMRRMEVRYLPLPQGYDPQPMPGMR